MFPARAAAALRPARAPDAASAPSRSPPICATSGDGRRIGFLKLVAGMLGVGLDDLVQREADAAPPAPGDGHRRPRSPAWRSTSGLALTAIQARDAARDAAARGRGAGRVHARRPARTKLEPIGRLDVLDGVGARALDYYSKQDTVAAVATRALAQRSQALTLMGEIAAKRGQTRRRASRYREAMAGTAEALRRDPDDPQRIFDHAQSVYLGRIDRGRTRPGRGGRGAVPGISPAGRRDGRG